MKMESPKLFKYICFLIKLCNNIKILTENKNYYKYNKISEQ